VSKDVVGRKAPVGNKDGASTIGIPVHEVADGTELILFHSRLKDAIQIPFTEEIIQGNGVHRVEPPSGSTARRVERIWVVRVSVDVELTAVATNEIIFAFVENKREMGVKLAQKVRECGREKLLALLIKSRVGKGRDIIVEEFEEFVCCRIALHGNEEAHEVFEAEFPYTGKIGAGVFGEPPRVIRHLGNVTPEMCFRPLW